MTAPTARPSQATITRHRRRQRFSLLVLSGFLSGCATFTGASLGAKQTNQAAEPYTFALHEIPTSAGPDQSVVTGFLLDGAVADLAVLHIDENGNRRLRIHSGDGGWEQRLDVTLGPDVLFVDVANIGGRDRLVTYAPGRLSWFDPDSETERPLVAVRSSFTPPREGEIPHVDLTRDLNDDGRVDLVVPGTDGFWVFVQMSDATFADPVQLDSSIEMSRILGSDGYRYDPWSQSRVHEMDYNHDDREDLVFWTGDNFEVHLQDERGLFASVAETFTTDVAFDSDDLSSLATGDMQGKVLHSITDLNSDGVADLVVFSLEGSGLSNKRSAFEVHFGAPTADGGTVFAPNVDAAIRSDGIQLGMDRHELDRNGQAGVMFTSIGVDYLENSFWKTLKGFMGEDIWLDLEFYPIEGGLFGDTPNATRRIALDGEPSGREPGAVSLDIVLRGGTHESRRTRTSWPRAFNRPLLIGDVTGDGRTDLLLGRTPEGTDVFVGVAGPELFARQPQGVGVPLPSDGEYTWLVDLNRDGTEDVLLHHPPCCRLAVHPDAAVQPSRVTMLISQPTP